MSLFAIGDLHLSFGVDKPMDVFEGWYDYQTRLEKEWQAKVKPDDTVVIAGDISWAMSIKEAVADFKFIEKLNGKKIILKGNHDFWWTTKNKIQQMFAENGISSVEILQNNSFSYGDKAICGTRGWISENGEPADAKVLAREALRLEMSIKSADPDAEKIVFLHYPPIFAEDRNYSIIDVLQKYNIKRCFYGHVHGKGCYHAFNGVCDGIDYRLISSDYLNFSPYLIEN
ncbi:MAG: metallophosphoesterase [Oscillospiraceae bacterium]